jgi:hypothetical protein
MDRMGHRSTRAALIYLHARDQRDKKIATGLNAMVTKLKNTQGQTPEGHAGGTEAEATNPKTGTDRCSCCWIGWSGRRESNPRSQFGRLGLYH